MVVAVACQGEQENRQDGRRGAKASLSHEAIHPSHRRPHADGAGLYNTTRPIEAWVCQCGLTNGLLTHLYRHTIEGPDDMPAHIRDAAHYDPALHPAHRRGIGAGHMARHLRLRTSRDVASPLGGSAFTGRVRSEAAAGRVAGYDESGSCADERHQ